VEKIKLGISACLLGENVRYDGGHRHDRLLTDTLGKYVQYVPVCPEVECGLGVPREPMRLVGDPESPRLVTNKTGRDFTEQMIRWARKRVRELEKENLCGFIFKSDSPSSGMERVKVYGEKGTAEKKGVGLFARVLMEHFPLLPVEEEGRLHDPLLRENFIERIFALQKWQDNIKTGRSRSGLVDFHTRHKLLLLAHSEKHTRAMGKLIARRLLKWVQPGETESSLAEDPQSLPDLGLRDHAAADASGHRHSLLPAFSASLSHGEGPGGRASR